MRTHPLRVALALTVAFGVVFGAASSVQAEGGRDRDRHEPEFWHHERHHEHHEDRWLGDGLRLSIRPAYPLPGVYREPAPRPSYYFCERPRGYYPSVPFCPTGWRVIPAG